MQIIFVTHFDPLPVGHGGVHRTYQIFNELEAVVGQGNVTLVKVWLQWWKEYKRAPSDKPLAARLGAKVERNRSQLKNPSLYLRPFHRISKSIRRNVARVPKALGSYAENPLKLLANTDYTTRSCSSAEFRARYERILDQTHPIACVLEHTTFADLIPLNARRNIPTLCCPQNLEAFDLMPLAKPASLNTAAIDFANEIRVLAKCDARLMISQVETAVVNAFGIPSHYYPYLPVGEIRAQHLQLRAERAQVKQEPGLFVMLGSAEHETTREAFVWFLDQVRRCGLPSGARVVVGGNGTDKLLANGERVPSVELRGWLEHAELQDLLLRAQAMLIPQRRGFGALTRLSEFACAGIPVIVSHHATFAQDATPGARPVGDDWNEWCAEMQNIIKHTPTVSADEYARWDARQPRTLSAVLQEFVHSLS